jgi:hypothetical protein
MARLNECLYLDQINWAYVYEPYTTTPILNLQTINNSINAKYKTSNYIIRPQSITINIMQQPLDFKAAGSGGADGGKGGKKSTTPPRESELICVAPRPQIQLDIHISDLKL